MLPTLSLLTTLLYATSVLAVAEPCSDHPGVKHSDPSYNAPSTKRPALYFNRDGKKKNALPKYNNPSANSLKNGCQNAVDQFASAGYLPGGKGSDLSNGEWAE